MLSHGQDFVARRGDAVDAPRPVALRHISRHFERHPESRHGEHPPRTARLDAPVRAFYGPNRRSPLMPAGGVRQQIPDSGMVRIDNAGCPDLRQKSCPYFVSHGCPPALPGNFRCLFPFVGVQKFAKKSGKVNLLLNGRQKLPIIRRRCLLRDRCETMD